MKLEFQFDSLQALLAMDGHGPYVWAAYGITFFALGALVWTSYSARKRFLSQQSAILSRRAVQEAES